MTAISESGLYAVILRSDKPNARAFRKWITSDVLPSIRKYGAYISDDALDRLIENPESAVRLFAKLKAERAKKEALEGSVKQLTPKAHYHDIVLRCPIGILATTIAKDYGMSCVRFNRLLRSLGFQSRYRETWYPRQKYTGKGYTFTHTYVYNGKCSGAIHRVFTQKGRRFLYDFLAEHGIYPQAEISDEA
jgi:phage antirepressor YoqD-like protein